jgi:hydroxymethylbilane synthase
MQQKLVIGTRGSPLALAQTKLFQARIQRLLPDWTIDLQIIKTTGDAWALQNQKELPSGKGIFTKELEEALLRGEIDLAVHSLKDLPVENPPGLTVALYPERESPLDLLITRSEKSLQELPPQATIATGSPRRVTQILGVRPDLKVVDIRGNIDTRLRKLRENLSWSGIILAEAGLNRLRPDLQGLVGTPLPSGIMLPAPGQGSLGIQMRENDPCIDLLKGLDCPQTRRQITAERSFLQALGGGCAQPIAALAQTIGGELFLEGFWSDGKRVMLRDKVVGSPQNPHSLGILLAKKILPSSETP